MVAALQGTERDTGLDLDRLQLLTVQGSLQCSGQQGEIRLQALGFLRCIVLSVGHKVIVLALA